MILFLDTSNSSAVYKRWGRQNCPSSAEVVLSGCLFNLDFRFES